MIGGNHMNNYFSKSCEFSKSSQDKFKQVSAWLFENCSDSGIRVFFSENNGIDYYRFNAETQDALDSSYDLKEYLDSIYEDEDFVLLRTDVMTHNELLNSINRGEIEL